MGFKPFPDGFDDGSRIFEFRFPAEFLASAVGTGDQARRIAGATGDNFRRNRMSGDLAGGIENLFYAQSAAGAEVVMTALRGEERFFMRLGKVENMDVVADAGSIGAT